MTDVELLERFRVAMHERQVASYDVHCAREALAKAEAVEGKAAERECDAHDALRTFIEQSGVYYFDPYSSTMIYRGKVSA